MKKLLIVLLFLAGLFPLNMTPGYACGVIIGPPPPHPVPPPPPPSSQRPILTRAHSADVTIKDEVAQVQVNATFYNPNPGTIEGTYWFPLPADAAIKDFKMEINGKPVQGELLDAAKARQIYDEIVRKKKDPALLEWVGSQMLQCRIFPFEGNKEVKVSLSYTQLLKDDGGLVRFRYPLRSAKPNEGNIDQLAMRVAIDSSVPLKTVYAPGYPFEITRKGDKDAVLSMEAKSVDPTRDVEVIFSRDKRDIGMTVLSCKAANDDGYFLMTVTPALKVEDRKVLAKDIIFVFDTSGSMEADNKIEQAKNALRTCIKNLNKDDRFNIIAFSTEARLFKNEIVDRTDASVKEALEFIDGLKPLGGTSLNEAMVAAMKMAKDGKSVPMIVLLTDGNPTVGEQNTEAILKNVKDARARNARVFVFGVGYDVNTQLLDLIAEQNAGAREYVKPKEDIEVKVGAFYSKIADPILANVKVDWGGADIDQVYPKDLPDLFTGSQLTVLGRYRKAGEYSFKLIGSVGDEKKEYTYKVKMSGVKTDEYVPRLWALRKVTFLLDQIRLHGENKELVDEVTRLGKLHGILTPYTSFLVIEEGAPVPPAMRREIEENRARYSRYEYDAKAGPEAPAAAAPADTSGQAEVQRSAESGQAKDANQKVAGSVPGKAQDEQRAVGFGSSSREKAKMDDDLNKIAQQSIRNVGSKTFYQQRDGSWNDAKVEKPGDPKTQTVAMWSDEFYKLCEKYPELKQYIATNGSRMIVELDGQQYRFSDVASR